MTIELTHESSEREFQKIIRRELVKEGCSVFNIEYGIGATIGMPDTFVCFRNRIAFIEFKKTDSPLFPWQLLRPSQRATFRQLIKHLPVIICTFHSRTLECTVRYFPVETKAADRLSIVSPNSIAKLLKSRFIVRSDTLAFMNHIKNTKKKGSEINAVSK